jgi:hypothetical protein
LLLVEFGGEGQSGMIQFFVILDRRKDRVGRGARCAILFCSLGHLINLRWLWLSSPWRDRTAAGRSLIPLKKIKRISFRN